MTDEPSSGVNRRTFVKTVATILMVPDITAAANAAAVSASVGPDVWAAIGRYAKEKPDIWYGLYRACEKLAPPSRKHGQWQCDAAFAENDAADHYSILHTILGAEKNGELAVFKRYLSTMLQAAKPELDIYFAEENRLEQQFQRDYQRYDLQGTLHPRPPLENEWDQDPDAPKHPLHSEMHRICELYDSLRARLGLPKDFDMEFYLTREFCFPGDGDISLQMMDRYFNQYLHIIAERLAALRQILGDKATDAIRRECEKNAPDDVRKRAREVEDAAYGIEEIEHPIVTEFRYAFATDLLEIDEYAPREKRRLKSAGRKR